MKAIKRALCASAALCLAAGAHAEASPWNRDGADLFTITRNAWFAAEGGEASEGTARRFEQSSVEVYTEYGLNDAVMAGGKAIYAWQTVTEQTASGADAATRLDGFAEAEVFVQGQVARWEGGALAVMATAAAPTRTSSRSRDGLAFERDARAGAAILAGWSLDRAFATMRAGPDISLGADAHTLRVEGTVGRRFGEATVLLGEAYWTQSLGGADSDGVDFSVLRVGPSVVLPVWGPVRLQLGGTFDVTGENVDLGASGFVAFWVGR